MTLIMDQYDQGPAHVIRLQGSLTADQNPKEITESVIAHAARRPGPILLNCSGVKTIDGAGLMALAASTVRALELNSNVVIASAKQPLLDSLERFEEQYGVANTIPVFTTHGAAMECLMSVPLDMGARNLRGLLESYGKSSFQPEPFLGGSTGP